MDLAKFENFDPSNGIVATSLISDHESGEILAKFENFDLITSGILAKFQKLDHDTGGTLAKFQNFDLITSGRSYYKQNSRKISKFGP